MSCQSIIGGNKFSIPFQQMWETPMLMGTKVCTSRTKRYGNRGDFFEVFGKIFVLRGVEELPLDWVANLLYKAEGVTDPGAFVGVWNTIHPNKGYVPKQRVYVHYFNLREW